MRVGESSLWRERVCGGCVSRIRGTGLLFGPLPTKACFASLLCQYVIKSYSEPRTLGIILIPTKHSCLPGSWLCPCFHPCITSSLYTYPNPVQHPPPSPLPPEITNKIPTVKKGYSNYHLLCKACPDPLRGPNPLSPVVTQLSAEL